jgi:hypothetical protein
MIITNGIQFPNPLVPSADPRAFDGYEEGTWIPVPTNLTVVGTPTYTGTYTRIGRFVFGTLVISSTTSTASAVASTSFAGFPFMSAMSLVLMASDSNAASLGTGLVSGNILFPPTWSARPNVYISFCMII